MSNDTTCCLNCLRVITSNNAGNRKFCNDNCYVHHTRLTNEIKKAEKNTIREINRALYKAGLKQ